MGELEWKELDEFLFARAMEHDSAKVLFRLACEYLGSARLVRPGVVKVLERVAKARERARVETWTRVEHLLAPRRRWCSSPAAWATTLPAVCPRNPVIQTKRTGSEARSAVAAGL